MSVILMILDSDSITVDDIKDTHKYLIRKNNIV